MFHIPDISKQRRVLALSALGIVAVALLAVTIAVAAPARSGEAPTFGTVPDSVLRSNGSISSADVPDFVPALDRDGNIAGYVKSVDVLEVDGNQPPDGPIPVVSLDGSLVGHMYPGVGFVGNGQKADELPRVPVTVVERRDGAADKITIVGDN